jgi:hydroxymethylbilane synthase
VISIGSDGGWPPGSARRSVTSWRFPTDRSRVRDRLRIGTRGSALALRQSEIVADGLRQAWPGLIVELAPIRTSGDRLATAHLAEVGGKGLFVKEIEEALLEGRVEVAVHSLKDLPGEPVRGLVLAAFPARADPRDVLVSRTGAVLAALPRAARVGTSSPRRRVQLLARRPDLIVEPIRGNVETRLRKLEEMPYEAIVLAAAGLQRLGLVPGGAVRLEPDEMLPAVGQGVLGVQIREDDPDTRDRMAPLDDPDTRVAVVAERAFLQAIGGSCTTPLAGYAALEDGRLRLRGLLATLDGACVLREDQTMGREEADSLGRTVAARMMARGAAEIVREGRVA